MTPTTIQKIMPQLGLSTMTTSTHSVLRPRNIDARDARHRG